MKGTKNLLTILLVSVSVSAQAQTWTEIDALIDTSAAIAGTLDESYLRIGGASSLVGTSIISNNMLTETYQYTSNGETITSQTTMQSTQTGQYNISVMDVMDAALKTIGAIKTLAENIGIPIRLSAYNISEDEIPLLAQNAAEQTRLLANNPKSLSKEEAEKIYRAAL